MKYCTKCGKELADDAAVCANCGSAVNNAADNAANNTQYNNGAQYNNGNPYGNPYGNTYSAPQKTNPASMILGIIGIVVSWFFALAGHATSIVGIVLGVKELKKNGSKAGLILSIIGEVCSVISSILGAAIAVSSYLYY